MLATMSTAPPPSSSCGAAARVIANAPVRLTSTMRAEVVHAVPLRAGPHGRDAGGVDDDLQAAQRVADLRDGPVARVRVGHVERDGDGLGPSGPQLGGGRLALVGAASSDRDPGALGRERRARRHGRCPDHRR